MSALATDVVVFIVGGRRRITRESFYRSARSADRSIIVHDEFCRAGNDDVKLYYREGDRLDIIYYNNNIVETDDR